MTLIDAVLLTRRLYPRYNDRVRLSLSAPLAERATWCSRATSVAGVMATFTMVVNVNANTANGATITTATAASASTDPVPGNNTGTATTVNRPIRGDQV